MSNPEERACGRKVGPDCKYLTLALHRWCSNEACCRRRGTTIPGVVKCPYYQPDRITSWSEFWESIALLLLFILCTWIPITLLLALVIS